MCLLSLLLLVPEPSASREDCEDRDWGSGPETTGVSKPWVVRGPYTGSLFSVSLVPDTCPSRDLRIPSKYPWSRTPRPLTPHRRPPTSRLRSSWECRFIGAPFGRRVHHRTGTATSRTEGSHGSVGDGVTNAHNGRLPSTDSVRDP